MFPCCLGRTYLKSRYTYLIFRYVSRCVLLLTEHLLLLPRARCVATIRFMPTKTAVARPAVRLSVRKLVEIQCRCDLDQDDVEIGVACGVEPSEIAAIVAREHWRERSLLAPGDDKAAQMSDQVLSIRYDRAVKAHARLLVFAGMELAGKSADAGDPRGFKDSAQGAKLFHEIAHHGEEQGKAASGPNLAAFYVVGVGVAQAGGDVRAMKQAERV